MGVINYNARTAFTVEDAIEYAQSVTLQNIRAMPHDVVVVTTHDKEQIRIMRSSLLVHGVFWKNIERFGAPVTKGQIYKVYPVNSSMVSNILTKQYAYLLKELPKVDNMEIVYVLWESIHRFYRFCYTKLGDYVCSIDLLDLVDIVHSDELKDLTITPIESKYGHKVFEKEYARRTAELNRLLSTPGMVKNNSILNYMQAGVFNIGQLVQMICALGCRDDVTGTMLPHIMTNSGLGGMKSLADLCTEAASPKKTTYYNVASIGDTQSFNKSMQLLTVNLVNVYPGDCGSRNYIQHTITPGKGANYVDKIIVLDNGDRVAITDSNYKEYEGQSIRLVSPIGCKYVDGVCEHCAGRASDKPWAYLPKIRIGSYAATKVFSAVSQCVLSAKHLIKTMTIELLLTERARKYLVRNGQCMLLLSSAIITDPKKWFLTVSTKFIGHPNDLMYDGVTPSGFGKFSRIGLINTETGENIEFDITASDMLHHFTQPFINHILKVRNKVTIDNGRYVIPLTGFNVKKQAVVTTIARNDDMTAYFKRISKMFETGLVGYPNIALALSSITNELHTKIDTNIFFIELIVKAILNNMLPEDGSIQMKTLKKTISDNNIATKLGHAQVRKWLYSTDPSVGEKQPSAFDNLFGFGT